MPLLAELDQIRAALGEPKQPFEQVERLIDGVPIKV